MESDPHYFEFARALGKMGRGAEPEIAFLEAWPIVSQTVGEGVLGAVSALLHAMQKSPNSKAMVPLLRSLPAVVRCVKTADALCHYLHTVRRVMQVTSLSIHGHHVTFESPGLSVLLAQAPRVLGVLTVDGFARWADYGARHYVDHPDRQRDYFGLVLPDSRAVLQRERPGTLFVTVERQLELTLRALWPVEPLPQLAPIPAFTQGVKEQEVIGGEHDSPTPWMTADGLCLPDVYDTHNHVSGRYRYRAALAHLAAHRRWSQPLVADNLSPLQRLSVECLEDARIDHLLLRRFPGLRPTLLALHPVPVELTVAETLTHTSYLRQRLAMLSRALLDPTHGYTDAALLECVASFHILLQNGEASTATMQTLALHHAARTRRQSDQQARVAFEHTTVSYRDDNRHLWTYIEDGDEEDSFTAPRPPPSVDDAPIGLPPRLYPEWDAPSQSYRPDWVSVYESLHPSGDAAHIDRLLAQHSGVAKQLQRLLDQLKPQSRQRIRYQEEGDELDLDVALRSVIDWRAGATPDPRILQRHKPNERSIAVLVLLDLSESLNDVLPDAVPDAVSGTPQTRLQLSLEAVALLAWAVDQLGDPLALAGFHSNTRHDVRYLHIKGFGEPWDAVPKARLAALEVGYSTRMGAALRHAARTLATQKADKKLLLVLTDGRPSDVDVANDEHLIADTHQAVQELAQQAILTHCVSVDPQADAYVHRIFGHHATVVDRLAQLPEQLARLFVRLTR